MNTRIHTHTHLVDIVSSDDIVKERVEAVEEVDDLDGGALGTDLGESHDVAEVDGYLVKQLRLHWFAQLQILSHSPGDTTTTKTADVLFLYLCVRLLTQQKMFPWKIRAAVPERKVAARETTKQSPHGQFHAEI